MTIKITSISKGGHTVTFKCFSCGNEEEAHHTGMHLAWSQFKQEVDINSGQLNVCLTCGSNSPRQVVAFGKYVHSSTVHLCIMSDGEDISSRCGTFSGSLLGDKCIEVDEVDSYSHPCKKCAVEMGAYTNSQIWKSEQGAEKELAFYRLL